jgi:hypothetical protein
MHTTSTSSVWITESSQGVQTLYGIVGVIVGGVFILGSRIQGLEKMTSNSALLLGLIIFVISLAVLVIGGKQIILVDPRRKLVELQTISRLGTKKRLIPFSQISDVSIAELGDQEGGSISFHVVLKLKDRKEVALFLGAFEGSYDKQMMEAHCHRLNEYLQGR